MSTKICPYCEEEIQAEAQKCRYCKEWINIDTNTGTHSVTIKGNNIKFTHKAFMLIGGLLVILLFLPICNKLGGNLNYLEKTTIFYQNVFNMNQEDKDEYILKISNKANDTEKMIGILQYEEWIDLELGKSFVGIAKGIIYIIILGIFIVLFYGRKTIHNKHKTQVYGFYFLGASIILANLYFMYLLNRPIDKHNEIGQKISTTQNNNLKNDYAERKVTSDDIIKIIPSGYKLSGEGYYNETNLNLGNKFTYKFLNVRNGNKKGIIEESGNLIYAFIAEDIKQIKNAKYYIIQFNKTNNTYESKLMLDLKGIHGDNWGIRSIKTDLPRKIDVLGIRSYDNNYTYVQFFDHKNNFIDITQGNYFYDGGTFEEVTDPMTNRMAVVYTKDSGMKCAYYTIKKFQWNNGKLFLISEKQSDFKLIDNFILNNIKGAKMSDNCYTFNSLKEVVDFGSMY